MLKKSITYIDFNGEQRTEDFYFNLTKIEIATMEISYQDGLKSKLEAVIAAKDYAEILNVFEDLVLRSYGEKSPDGKRFIKDDDKRNSFAATDAYSELILELTSSAEAAAAFANGIIPRVKEPGDHLQLL